MAKHAPPITSYHYLCALILVKSLGASLKMQLSLSLSLPNGMIDYNESPRFDTLSFNPQLPLAEVS